MSLVARQRHDEDRMTTGFKECRDVTMRFLVEHHGEDSVGPLCTSLLLHLYDHMQSISGTGLAHASLMSLSRLILFRLYLTNLTDFTHPWPIC